MESITIIIYPGFTVCVRGAGVVVGFLSRVYSLMVVRLLWVYRKKSGVVDGGDDLTIRVVLCGWMNGFNCVKRREQRTAKPLIEY